METITFSEKNSYADFGLILQNQEIGEPTPQTHFIKVPYRNGELDLTEAFGEVAFDDRTNIFTFEYLGNNDGWRATLSAFKNYVHGRRHKIFNETNYYWVGRCNVKASKSSKGIYTITVECKCEPYKYKLNQTIVEIVATTEVLYTVINDRKTVTPKITVLSGEPIISWTDKETETSYQNALASNFDNKIVDLKLYEGSNAIKVSGGSIRLTYQEASL